MGFFVMSGSPLVKNWKAQAAAVAMSSLVALSPAAATAEQAAATPNQSEFQTVAMTTEEEYGPVQAPTAERPYYLVNFDAELAQTNPEVTTVGFEHLHADKIVIMNFVREGDQISDIQTQEIAQMLSTLAEEGSHKDLMLVNVTAVDAAGEPVHAAAYQSYYENNTLIGGGIHKTQGILPYAAMYATSPTVKDEDFAQVFDFSLLSNPTNQELVTSQAQFNGYVDGLRDSLRTIVEHYNHQGNQPDSPENETIDPLVNAQLNLDNG